MNPDVPNTPRAELEARLTALLLGEVPAAEAAALQQALAQDPELAALHERLKFTVELVRETATVPTEETATQPAALRLSDERRQELLQRFKTVRPREFARRRVSLTLLEMAAVLAILGVLVALLLPTLSRGKYKTVALSHSPAGIDAEVSSEKIRRAAGYRVWGLASEQLSEADKKTPSPAKGGVYSANVVGFNNVQIESRDRQTLTVAPTAAKGQPTANAAPSTPPASTVAGNGIILPPTESWYFQNGDIPAAGAANKPAFGLSVEDADGVRARRSPAGPAPEVAGRPVVADASGVAGEPGWAGTVSASDKTPNTENHFAGRYSYFADLSSRPGVAAATTPGTAGGRLGAFHLGSETAVNGDYGVSISKNSGTAGVVEQNWDSAVSDATRRSKKSVPVLGEQPVLGRLFGLAQESAAKAGKTPAAGAEATTAFSSTVGDVLAFVPPKSEAPLSAGFPIVPEEKVRSVPAQPAPENLASLGTTVDRDVVNGSVANTLDSKPGSLSAAQKDAFGRSQSNQQLAWQDSATRRGYAEAMLNGDVPAVTLSADTLRRAESQRLEGKAKLDSQRKYVADLDKKGDRVTSKQIAQASQSRDYFDAMRNLEQLQSSTQALDARMAAEKIDSLIPKSTMVEVAERADAAQGPSKGEKLRLALGGQVERSARVRLELDQTDVVGMSQVSEGTSYDPYFVQTEFDLIRSDRVLSNVVAKLNLREAWANKPDEKLSAEEALKRLRSKLDLTMPANTSLVNIGVKSDKPEEAAKLANAIADAYGDYRAEKRQQLALGEKEALKALSTEQHHKLQQAQAEVERLRKLAEGEKQEADAVKKPRAAAPAPVPQPEILTCDNAFSTFSLNVSDVSFKLAAASLEKGVLPEPANVRSEEFINAFDYRDPEAPAGVPVAFAWERAAYPFAQNRDLLRFSLKTAAAGRQAGRPLNIVLLLDDSGSMERADRVRIIREALRVLATQLQPQDKFSIVTFARTARLWVDGVPGNEAAKAAEAVANLNPEGGTNLEEAMNLAYQTALRHYLPTGINRVVLLTDGAANLGEVEPESLKQKVETNRKQGIAFDCFGIGWEGYNDDLLEVLSRNGDGRYGFVNTPEEAATEFAAQLAGALHVAASDVKVQVEFNPNRVTAYRQIGYAKHQLTKEQFRDNTVDAAELGAAEAGNALYVVEVNPRGEGPLATVRIRYKVPGTTDYREQEWPVPYSGNAVRLEQASPAMRLAAAASAFSEWLVSSPYAAEVTPDQLLGYLGGVPEVYGADPRPRKLEWMVRQAKSLTGK